jgi:hypothetical protein
LKPGGKLPAGPGWVKSGQPKTTADNFQGFLGQVDAGLAAHRRAGRPIPSMQPFTVSSAGVRFVVIMTGGPQERIVSAFPENAWL